MKKIEKTSKIIKDGRFIMTILFIVAFSCITIGYAAYDKILPINGNVIVKKYGILEITNITLLSSSNVQSTTVPSYDDNNAVFNIVFGGTEEKYEAVYQIELTNNSSSDYIYSDFDYNETVTSANGKGVGTLTITTEGIQNGDVIAPDETKVFNVTLHLDVTDPDTIYNAELDSTVTGTHDKEGHLTGSITPKTGDLSDTNERTAFTLDLINTYVLKKDFTLKSSNSNFLIVDSNGNALSPFSIEGNSEDTFTFYLKKKDGAIFLNNTASTTIQIKTNSDIADIDIISLNVDIYVAPDTDKVEVGNANITISDTEGEFTAAWSRIDEGGSSVTNYTILLYNSSNTLVSTTNTNSDVTSHTFTGISADTYYFVVYGTDEAGNTGSSDVSGASTANGYATKSSSVNLKWVFSVNGTTNVTNLTFNGTSSANLHQSYTATLSANSNYSLPTSITITMGGTTLTSGSDYTYSSSSGSITINSVTGDIVITATGERNICLVKGTKIMLANGKYKNIENVRYNDLLLVYSHETGKFTYEYPAWIEKEGTTTKYQLNTFSDGTTLKTTGFHGIFNKDLNKYVSVDNPKEFYVGAHVLKINKTHTGFDFVTVTNINEINKKVNYYHVVSTRYYNVIANDFLTTDGTIILSNLYGFDQNLRWTNLRTLNDVYSYNDFKRSVPKFMFISLRMEEAKYLTNYGLNKNIFMNYLLGNQLNKDMVLPPVQNKNHNNLWMVTTSDDIVNELNKNNYQKEEGTMYILNQPKNKHNFVGWLNSVDNKIYHIGDHVTINCGTHFTAMYK